MSNIATITMKAVSDSAASTHCGRMTFVSNNGTVIFEKVPAHSLAVQTGDYRLGNIIFSEDTETIDEFGNEALVFGDVSIYCGRQGRDGRIRPAHQGDIRLSQKDFSTLARQVKQIREKGGDIVLEVKRPWFMFGKELASRENARNVPFRKKTEHFTEAHPAQQTSRTFTTNNQSQPTTRQDDYVVHEYTSPSHSHDDVTIGDVMFMNAFPEIAPYYKPNSLYAWYLWHKDQGQHQSHHENIPVSGFDGVTQREDSNGDIVLYRNGREVGRIAVERDGEGRIVMTGNDGTTSSIDIGDGNISGNVSTPNGGNATFNGNPNGFDTADNWSFDSVEGISVNNDYDGIKNKTLDTFDKPMFDGASQTVSLDSYDKPSDYDGVQQASTQAEQFDFGRATSYETRVDTARYEEPAASRDEGTTVSFSGTDPYDS